MVMTLAISKYVNSLLEVETKFSVQQSLSDRFFSEWDEDLPELTEAEKERCDLLKERYLYHRHHGHISEGLVNQIAIAPLLEMASFYDPPFDIRAEYPVQLESIEFDENEETIYQGRIDTLVIYKKLWVLVIESKGQAFSIESGMAQALTYMLDSPNQLQPTYGFISNGGFSIFLKVVKGEVMQYQFSNDFSLYNRRNNELLSVLQILKKISRLLQ
ncbi:type I restriction endonuclease subunit R [Pseudanabaena sp. SR411]|uniref:type I restriction endonuclease subunit R n=1 Tax=Pseudanabaena sp. SR411 TaxID=1980935 RepID=UPI000B99D530|nr:type I restriction endonuclease subunit R [Pseudanabaena sp. SR411]OYQ68007.1 type I restriction endonuclease subunit R [Pseudanabaena sp. SR411]